MGAGGEARRKIEIQWIFSFKNSYGRVRNGDEKQADPGSYHFSPGVPSAVVRHFHRGQPADCVACDILQGAPVINQVTEARLSTPARLPSTA